MDQSVLPLLSPRNAQRQCWPGHSHRTPCQQHASGLASAEAPSPSPGLISSAVFSACDTFKAGSKVAACSAQHTLVMCPDSCLPCPTGLDYLSSPSGVIKAAQELAARAFNAQQTWFLVNGCSVAIHAAVMATVRPGQALLLARNCHLSAFAACVLSDAVPVWLQPEQDALHGIAHCVTPQQLQRGFEEAQARGLKVGAVLVVSPTYYGAVARIPGEEGAALSQGSNTTAD